MLLDFGAPPSTWNTPFSRPAHSGTVPQKKARPPVTKVPQEKARAPVTAVKAVKSQTALKDDLKNALRTARCWALFVAVFGFLSFAGVVSVLPVSLGCGDPYNCPIPAETQPGFWLQLAGSCCSIEEISDKGPRIKDTVALHSKICRLSWSGGGGDGASTFGERKAATQTHGGTD